jgi:prepilin-type N-terminal cleavage/methylation domain-containing protein
MDMKMKKRGFTLVELLVVIAVIALNAYFSIYFSESFLSAGSCSIFVIIL